jgi:hypothetical protein
VSKIKKSAIYPFITLGVDNELRAPICSGIVLGSVSVGTLVCVTELLKIPFI